MEDNNLRNALRELSRSACRSKASQLRELFDEVMNLKDRGFTHAQIINVMQENGLKFNLKTFELTFYRIKKDFENGKSRQIQVAMEMYSEQNKTGKMIQKFTEEDKTPLPKTGFHRIVEALSVDNSEKDPRRGEM